MATMPKAADQKTKLLNRLRRLEGQVRGLQKMVEEDRACDQVLTLIAGVRGGLEAVGEILLESYLEDCRANLGKTDTNQIIETIKLVRR
ncbi:MAG: metal-sensitive transcriptional regulator [Deinococcus sp.]|nr:metal-sensitive transcriptional regulator [Deinococcus sp.]MCL5964387.1 metal-sensitive transcriptional regulator [Deinococcus sp.]